MAFIISKCRHKQTLKIIVQFSNSIKSSLDLSKFQLNELWLPLKHGSNKKTALTIKLNPSRFNKNHYKILLKKT